MQEAKERVIEILIDSGGEPWKFDSMDVGTLVEWIEITEKQIPETQKHYYELGLSKGKRDRNWRDLITGLIAGFNFGFLAAYYLMK